MGADTGGRLLLFDVTTARGGKPATVNVLAFGVGGEECGHARATPPSVSILGEPVTKVPAGKTASLSLNVFAADTQSVEWRFEDNGKAEADEPPVIESYPFPTQVPTLTHEFKHGGNYEILAIVEPDDFGPKIEEHSDVTVEGRRRRERGDVARSAPNSAIRAPRRSVSPRSSPPKSPTRTIKASPHAQYKYVWEFGDGATAEGSGGREFRAEHVYAIEGRYEVKLTVIDEARPDHGCDARGPGERPAEDPGEHGELAASAGGGNGGGGGRRRQRRYAGCDEHACPRRHAGGYEVAGRERVRRGDAEAGVPGGGDELLGHGDAADPGSGDGERRTAGSAC